MSVKLDGLKVFENRVLRRILGPNVKTSQETGKHCLVRCCIYYYYYYYYYHHHHHHQLRTAALRLIVRSWLDVPTFVTRRLHACHHARAPSGERWNCGREMSSNVA